MKYYVRVSAASDFTGPWELSEIQRQVTSGALAPDAEALEARGQTHGQLKRSIGWVPVSTLIQCGASLRKPLTASTHCFVLSGPDRRGPFVLAQIRTMWQAGAITADAWLEWEGAEPVPIATALAVSAQPEIAASSSENRNSIIVGMAILGGIAGLLASYLMRPRMFGQGPTFEEWFTKGLDSPFASTIYTCAGVGLVVGCVVGYLIAATAQDR